MWNEAVVLLTNPGLYQLLEWLVAAVHSHLVDVGEHCTTHPLLHSLSPYVYQRVPPLVCEHSYVRMERTDVSGGQFTTK